MIKTFAAFVIATGFALPAAANDTWARDMDLDPDEFSLNEIVQIDHAAPGREREQRIALIRKKHVEFAEAVRAAQVAAMGQVSTSN